jgi:hypothetical protein
MAAEVVDQEGAPVRDFNSVPRFEFTRNGALGRYVDATHFGDLLREYRKLDKAFDELLEIAKQNGVEEVCR